MKFLLFIALTLTAVFAEGDYDDIGELDENLVEAALMIVECRQQFSLDEDTIDKIILENFRGTEQSKCFMKCMLEKLRFINEKGEVQLGNYHESIPKDDPVWEIMPQCRHIVVAKCEDALTLEKCNDNVVAGRMASILRK